MTTRSTPTAALGLVLATLAAMGPGCESATTLALQAREVGLPARPDGCIELPVGTDLTATLASSDANVFCLAPGNHPGLLKVSRALTLWGPRTARVVGGKGSTILIDGQGATLSGFTVDGSGTRVDTLDSAIRIQASQVTLDGLRVTNAFFGITSDKSSRITIRRCDIDGGAGEAIGQRGDAIRLWETNDSVVEDNRVTGSRDVVVWYSSRNTLRGNHVTNGRYGTHFMFSHDNVVDGNTYLGNTVAIFVMYSRNLSIQDNVLSGSTGSAGIGLGLKESGNLRVLDNRFLHDTTGIYVDTSPLNDTDENVFRGNELRFTQAAVTFHGTESRNTFEGNRFADNRAQVLVEGGADALGVTFRGNDFDDYQGYDLDGDGTGDLPYEVRSLTGDLVGRHPDIAFLSGTPVLALMEIAGRALPLFSPKLLLRDPTPRVGAPTGGG